MSLPNSLIPPSGSNSPSMSRKRRYSRDHFDKTVVSMLQSKIPDDRLARFVVKAESYPKPDLSLGILRKTIRLQKNKIKNYVDSIDTINKFSLKKNQRKTSWSILDWQRKNNLRKPTTSKSAMEILSALLNEEIQDENFDLESRKGSMNCLTPTFNRKQKIVRQSTFTKSKENLINVISIENEEDHVDGSEISAIRDKSLDQEEPPESFTFGSRRRLISKDDDAGSFNFQVSEIPLKFPSLRKDSRATTDSNIHAGMSRFSGKESLTHTDLPEMTEVLGSQNSKRSRRALAVQECENIEVTESDYKMTFINSDFPLEGNQREPRDVAFKQKPTIMVSAPEQVLEAESRDKPLNKRLQGIKNLLREEGFSSVEFCL